MEELICPDQATFASVWARVMEGKPNPIVVGASPQKQPPKAPSGEKPKAFCFADPKEEPLLQEALLASGTAVEDFRKLEKQLPQSLKPLVHGLITRRKKEFNQIETALFLLTGEKTPLPHTTEIPIPVAADRRLRQRFLLAQEWQRRYQKAAFQTEDSCLTTLFLQLESALKEEVKTLHTLVEEVFWLKNR